ncbi:ABC transporter permease [Streptomyces barringtoniae]|uniref:ABC transporter permease n=1 Tax=Streptomyces barringtoniae TaxID=2892029 RepID=UPI001E29D937|nr:ABC transporter permease [Streptomyces barringtoniae]MCC5481019.1 ABC transporter permease [Streptomyces barringtoniae]
MTTDPTVPRPRTARWLLRLHRPALYGFAALVIVLAGLELALAGPLADAAAAGWRQFDACHTSICSYDQAAILRYKDYYEYATYALDALPFLVAAWAGAALTGRELETGTARLSWTQGISPARWLTVRLVLPAALVAAATCLLVWLHHRAWAAGRGRIDTASGWYTLVTFHANGPTIAALALAGLAAGTLAGLLLRRTLPALVLGVLVTVGVAVLAQQLMPHLWPTVTRVTTLQQGGIGSAIVLDQGLLSKSGAHLPMPNCTTAAACDAAFAKASGYYTVYHPYAHYWPLQLTTTALLLAITALLALASCLVLRRLTGALRAAGTAVEAKDALVTA